MISRACRRARGTAEVRATTAEQYRLDLTAAQPPAVRLLISTPCYRAA